MIAKIRYFFKIFFCWLLGHDFSLSKKNVAICKRCGKVENIYYEGKLGYIKILRSFANFEYRNFRNA